ncbi:RDD family protein [Aurantibacter sp.]|uniref:RDD family protein n=1 Tax=Aurantibacter sp. TaxID=2807103 RepID=UPI0035C7A1CD
MKVNKILASNEKRFYNYLIDSLVKVVLGIIISVIVGLYANFTNDVSLYNVIVEEDSYLKSFLESLIIGVLYYTVIETYTGKSIGKYITKTRVVLEDGSNPEFSDVFLRSLCRHIPFDAFSFLGEPGKGWHDSLSKTYVIDEKKLKEQEAIKEIDNLGKDIL